MNATRRKFARNLRGERIAIGLSQEQLALCIGVCRLTVSDWECGRSLPTMHNQRRLRVVFGDTALLDVALLNVYEAMRR
jgi:transcriptional regulator with XRE-family HTH domain